MPNLTIHLTRKDIELMINKKIKDEYSKWGTRCVFKPILTKTYESCEFGCYFDGYDIMIDDNNTL